MATPRKSNGIQRNRRPKATTPEARENQLTALAYDVAEEQMLSGTAPAMVVVHFLKLKTTEQKLKEEKLRKENLLLEAKTESYGSMRNAEDLYDQAVKAIREYQGQEDYDEEL